MSNSNFYQTLKELTDEKNLPLPVLISAIEDALVVAYKKNFDPDQEIRVVLDKELGNFKVISTCTVVPDESFEDANKQYTLEEALEINSEAKIGDLIEEDVTPPTFGRVAAQTARQIVAQKFKEAERNVICKEFERRIGEVMSGKVQRIERGVVHVEFAKAEAILPQKEQIPGEFFRTNDRIKCYIQEVRRTSRGAQIILSRSCAKFVEELFSQAVPEIMDKIVQIKGVSREPGYRIKLAVYSKDSKVDPVGACVGLKGSRIRGIVDELNGEKIDIIRFSENPVEYVTNALSPAKIQGVTILDGGRSALAVAHPSQLSLAIGKEGQNVKLASKLTGIKIDIKADEGLKEILSSQPSESE